MKICLETSCIIGFANDEPDCRAIEILLDLAETNHLELFVSSFAWQETRQPSSELGKMRIQRLKCMANPTPKVARIGESMLGECVLGHDDSCEVEVVLSRASRPDIEQFLSYAAVCLDFFVTKDNHYLKKSVQTKLTKEYGSRVGNPQQCLNWLKERGVY